MADCKCLKSLNEFYFNSYYQLVSKSGRNVLGLLPMWDHLAVTKIANWGTLTSVKMQSISLSMWNFDQFLVTENDTKHDRFREASCDSYPTVNGLIHCSGRLVCDYVETDWFMCFKKKRLVRFSCMSVFCFRSVHLNCGTYKSLKTASAVW